jgi:choice-of-anchor B domain-containing protein
VSRLTAGAILWPRLVRIPGQLAPSGDDAQEVPVRHRSPIVLVSVALAAAHGTAAQAGLPSAGPERRLREDAQPPATPHVPRAHVPCVNGFAGPYPCRNVDLLSVIPLSGFTVPGVPASTAGNSLWGWRDPQTGREYALMGLDNGTAFVDVSDPEAPVYVGFLRASGNTTSAWRDIKTYQNHAFVVSEAAGHGMQVFDLTRLRSVASPPVVFTADAHYAQFGRAHTLALNEATGFAYAVGSQQGALTCSTGIHMVDVRNPLLPNFAGCYDDGGYVHEVQCVVYQGPDTAHVGREICLAARGGAHRMDVVDVTDKAAPVRLSALAYNTVGYSHQGWLTEDHRYLLWNDELDEQNLGHATRTFVFDVSDLDAPVSRGYFQHQTAAIDHNLYVKGGHVYESNYRAGLRILRLDDLAAAALTERAFFDIYPANDAPSFNGNWNNYPFFSSGVVALSGIEQGLFLVRPDLCEPPAPPGTLTATAAGDNRVDLAWAPSSTPGVSYVVERGYGACPGADFQAIATGVTGTAYSDTAASGQVGLAYRVSAVPSGAQCASPPGNCASATTTGACTAPPAFVGLGQVTNPATATCALDLSWSAAGPRCSPTASYNVHRSPTPAFTPGPANRIASGVAGLAFTDRDVASGQARYYVARAVDPGSGAEDGNVVERSGTPTGPFSDGTWTAGAEVGDPPLGPAALSPDHAAWDVTTARARTGARSYFSGYANSDCVALTLPPLTLTAGQTSVLSFWTAHDIETDWDGGVVEVSTNGGASWQPVTPTPGYPGAFNSGADACGYATGQGSFTGANLTWTQYTVGLGAYAGSTVRVRFNFSTDASITREGWYLDDLAVTHAQVPGPCASDLLFRDGFGG